MKFSFEASINENDYLSRTVLFYKRNIKLFILDFLLILSLIIPPFSIRELYFVLIGFAILSIRDIIILRKSIYHIERIDVVDSELHIKIYKYNKPYINIRDNVSNFNMELKYFASFSFLQIQYKNDTIINQYPVGTWSEDKLTELNNKYYNYILNLKP